MNSKECEPKLRWMTFPDGRRYLRSCKCSCCGQEMLVVEVEEVDCGRATHFECPKGHSAYSWYNLIEEC